MKFKKSKFFFLNFRCFGFFTNFNETNYWIYCNELKLRRQMEFLFAFNFKYNFFLKIIKFKLKFKL